MDIVIEPGKTYITKRGTSVTIKGKLDSENLFYAGNGTFYRENGKCDFSDDSELDDILCSEEMYRVLLSPPPADDFVTVVNEICEWGRAKFGEAKASVLVARAQKEMKELSDLVGDEWTPEAVEEAADVFLVLTRAPGLAEAILRKHAINVSRSWDIRQDGTAYHTKPEGGIAPSS